MSTNSRNNGTRRNNGRNRDKPILTFQSKGYYQILVGNYGLEKLCREVHRSLFYDQIRSYSDSDSDGDYEYKKYHFKENGPSEDQLIYIVLICHFYRCYKLGVLLGYYQELDMQMLQLQRRLEYIELPAILCDYIESIGKIKLKNGITVVPWFAPAADFYAPELAQLHPLEVLNRAGRSQCIHPIFIDINWLNSNWCLFRTSNKQLKMRKISWDKINGNIKMIMTTKVMNENEQSQHIILPQTCLEVEAEVGLRYNFRRFSEQAKWPADTLKVCQNFFYSYTYNDHFDLHVFDKVASASRYIPSCKSPEILVGNYGVEQLCKIVHISIYSFHWCDPTLDQLIYVMLMCHFLRCYDINFRCDEDMRELKYSLNHLDLPSILCKYIETIGSIKLKNGIDVRPWCGSREEEFYSPNLGQLTPKEVLERAGRPVPENKWCIDYEWIEDFRNRLRRIDQSSPPWLQLRKIDWDNKKGGIEMIVSTKVDLEDEQAVIATAPQSCLEVEAQRGAVFNYRRFSEQSHWPKDTSLICQDYFRARKFIPLNVLKSFYQN